MNKNLKKLIVIENGQSFQCDTMEELIKELIDKDYYDFSKEKKEELLKMKCELNFLEKDNKLIDEKSYILSLVKNNKIVLLEEKNSNIFLKDINKKNEKNYIIVNNFINEIL